MPKVTKGDYTMKTGMADVDVRNGELSLFVHDGTQHLLEFSW